MNMLSGLDFVLVGIYFVILLFIGYVSSKGQRDEDYLIANRKLGAWSTAATINASKTGAILMTFVSLVYIWGVSAVWYFVGMFLGILLFIPFSLKLKRESGGKYYTLADYFRHSYGKRVAVFASVLSVFLMFGFFVINLIAGAKLFAFFSGWNFVVCSVVMIFVVLSYLLMGGFRAVVKTDILQYIAIVFIMLVLMVFLFGETYIPLSEWSFFYAGPSTIFGFFLLGLLFPFAMPELWQRVYSSRDAVSLKSGLIISSFVYLGVGLLLGLLALSIKVGFPGVDPDLALVYGFANLLPPGLLGLSVVLLFAAIMSSLDTYIFTGASAVVQDFFDWDKKKVVHNIKWVMFGFAVLGMVVSILIQSLLVGSYIFVAVSIVLACCVLATWIKGNVSEVALISGFVFGLAGFLIFLMLTIGEEISPNIVAVSFVSTLFGIGIGGIIAVLRK